MSSSSISSTARIFISALSMVIGANCSTLIGNVKPIAEKSDHYGIMDLSRENVDWQKLPASTLTEKESDSTETEISDVAFQSKRTASIISINSGCRASYESESRTLRSFTNLLLLGMTEITRRDEIHLSLQDAPALETIVEGKMNGENMTLKTLVVRRHSCVYDLVYISRPKHFSEQEKDFSQFVTSLRLK